MYIQVDSSSDVLVATEDTDDDSPIKDAKDLVLTSTLKNNSNTSKPSGENFFYLFPINKAILTVSS